MKGGDKMEKSLLESNMLANALKNNNMNILVELDMMQHIDILDNIAFVNGANAKLEKGEVLSGDYAKIPSTILDVFATLQPIVKKVANNELVSDEKEKKIVEEYCLEEIKQILLDNEFEQEQEYRK